MAAPGRKALPPVTLPNSTKTSKDRKNVQTVIAIREAGSLSPTAIGNKLNISPQAAFKRLQDVDGVTELMAYREHQRDKALGLERFRKQIEAAIAEKEADLDGKSIDWLLQAQESVLKTRQLLVDQGLLEEETEPSRALAARRRARAFTYLVKGAELGIERVRRLADRLNVPLPQGKGRPAGKGKGAAAEQQDSREGAGTKGKRDD